MDRVGPRGEEIRWTEARGAVHRAEGGEQGIRTEGGGRRAEEMIEAEEGFGGLGGGRLLADIGENVTNEDSLCENASKSEIHKSVQVTANSDDVLGLDNLETKPTDEGRTCRAEGGGRRAEEIVGTEERGGGTEERGGGTEEARQRERAELAEARSLDGVLADRMAKIKARFGPMSGVIRERLLASPEAMAILGPYLPKGAAVEGEELPRSGGGSVTTPERRNEDEEINPGGEAAPGVAEEIRDDVAGVACDEDSDEADEDADECPMSLEELVAAGHITEAEKRHEEEEEAKLLALQAKVAAWGTQLKARDGAMAEAMKNILSASPEAMEILGQFLPRGPTG